MDATIHSYNDLNASAVYFFSHFAENAIIVHISPHNNNKKLFRVPRLELKDYEFIIWASPEGSIICPKSKYIRFTSYCKNEDFLKVSAKFTHLGSPMTEIPHFWN